MSERLEKLLLAARVREPYHGRAFAALAPVYMEIGTPSPTLAVNAKWQLLWSDKALDRWTEDEAVAVLCHEVRHLLRRHPQRGAAKAADLIDAQGNMVNAWNICADAEINDDLDGLPRDCVFPKHLGQPDHLLAEEYYDNLLDSAKKVTVQKCGCRGGGGKLEGEDDTEEQGLSEVEADLVREQVAHDIKTQEGSAPGTVPKGDVVWANAEIQSLKKHIPWERILAASVKRALAASMRGRDDYSWGRMHRRNRAGAVLRPGMIKYRPQIGIVWDTSGSMDQYGGKAMAVHRSIERTMNGAQLHEWDCDVNAIKRRGKKSAHLGGGGTDMRVGISEACRFCDVVVVITDGESPFPEAPERKESVVIALLKPEHEAQMPSWCETVCID